MILNIENAKSWPICPFWPILDIILQIYALFGIRFTGLHNAVVYQNWQISGIRYDPGNWLNSQYWSLYFWPRLALSILVLLLSSLKFLFMNLMLHLPSAVAKWILWWQWRWWCWGCAEGSWTSQSWSTTCSAPGLISRRWREVIFALCIKTKLDDCVLGQLDCNRAHGNLDLHCGVLGYLDLADGIFMHLDLHDGVGEEKEESKGKDGKKDPRDGWPTLPPEFMETTTIQPEKDAIWRLACNSPILI